MRKRRVTMIDEIDTGEIWECPICRRKFKLIHREYRGKVYSHKLEEIWE